MNNNNKAGKVEGEKKPVGSERAVVASMTGVTGENDWNGRKSEPMMNVSNATIRRREMRCFVTNQTGLLATLQSTT